MDIFASGFNAHNQLEAAENKGPAKDVSTFSRIATGNDIKVLFAGWSCTICKNEISILIILKDCIKERDFLDPSTTFQSKKLGQGLSHFWYNLGNDQ
jgi:hypothetical protein